MAINFKGLNTTIHAPARLQVLVALQTDGSLDYATLKQRIAVSTNSLALHLGKLEEAKYIGCEKACVGERQKTIYHITPVGQKALANYLAAMQSIIDSVKNAKAK
jgi:DNA-binding PadR family transcriptional regulator